MEKTKAFYPSSCSLCPAQQHTKRANTLAEKTMDLNSDKCRKHKGRRGGKYLGT